MAAVLQIAAMAFCEQQENVQLLLGTKTLWLSMILAWYSVDFGSDKLEVARTVAGYLRGEDKAALTAWIADSAPKNKATFKTRHFVYDWTTDDAASARYKPSTQTTNKSCVLQ